MRTRLGITLAGCFAAASLFLAGCRAQQAAADATDATGVYALVSVDGKPVPAHVSHGSDTLLVRSGTFTIRADGSCVSAITLVPPTGKEATREVSATYVKKGATLTMRWKGAGQTVGTVSGKTFTMQNEGLAFVYEK